MRLSLYKRLASAVDEAQVADIAEEMEDRFGPPPEEARRLVQLMSLKTELRRLKVLGCEANGARRDAPPARGHAARSEEDRSTSCARRRARYRLTPDMRPHAAVRGGRRAVERGDDAGGRREVREGLSGVVRVFGGG